MVFHSEITLVKDSNGHRVVQVHSDPHGGDVLVDRCDLRVPAGRGVKAVPLLVAFACVCP
jgi:hypothetical protein